LPRGFKDGLHSRQTAVRLPAAQFRWRGGGKPALPAWGDWPYTGALTIDGSAAMTARIFKPSKTAMQSGQGNTKAWVLEFEPEEPRTVEPLMGWTSSVDTRQQVRLRFDDKQEAIAYCERHGIAYQVFDTKAPAARRVISYSDNFAFKRRDAWTH
jgi:NADH dehydrogenase ubiquinone Fe-S protein 4